MFINIREYNFLWKKEKEILSVDLNLGLSKNVNSALIKRVGNALKILGDKMDQFCERLNNAIKDEQKAPADYEMLESLSQTKKKNRSFKR